MDLQILQDKLNELANELKDIRTQLEEAENEQQKSRRWKPQDEEIYYYIEKNGLISCIRYTNDPFDKMVMAVGNYFATKEEAEFEVERLKVLAEMREFEESPDMEWDCRNFHYYIFYNTRTNNIGINSMKIGKDYNIFFESEEKAEECIEKVGADRIKKYYLRIKED